MAARCEAGIRDSFRTRGVMSIAFNAGNRGVKLHIQERRRGQFPADSANVIIGGSLQTSHGLVSHQIHSPDLMAGAGSGSVRRIKDAPSPFRTGRFKRFHSQRVR
jgi:hypothetical protein